MKYLATSFTLAFCLFLMSFTSSNRDDSESYYSLSPISTLTNSRMSPKDIVFKYVAQSCVTGEGCCGIRCVVGSFEQCCAATTCICLSGAQQDAIASELDWQELHPVIWNYVTNEQLMRPEIMIVLDESIDYCLN